MSSAEQARWFSEHVQPHEPALRAYLSKRFPSLPDHDDLVQETYVRVLRVGDSARLVHPKAFLFTTARNDVIARFNARSRIQLFLADPALADRRIGGTFALDEAEAFVRLLERDGEIVGERRGETAIRS